MAKTLLDTYVSAMPLTDDMEEAHSTNEFLATGLLKTPEAFLGAQGERLEHIVTILGVISTKKQSKPETLDKLAIFIANISNGAVGANF